MEYGLRTESIPIPTPEQIDLELQKFVGGKGLGALIDHPPGKDQTLAHFGEAVLEDLEDDDFPELKEVAKSYIRDRPNMLPAYRSQLFWRVIHNQAIRHDKDYPRGYDKARWQIASRLLLKNAAIREEIEQDLVWFDVMSNEPRRGAGIKLAIAASKNVLPTCPQGITIAEAGSSAGLILKGLQSDTPLLPKEIEATDEARQRLYGIMAARMVLHKGYGIDIWPLDKRIRHWIEASSHYPEEILDTQLEQERKRVYRTPAKNIHSYTGDFATPTFVEEFSHFLGDEEVDVSAAITSLYLLEKREQRIALNNLANLGSITIVQDFAELNPDDHTQLQFYEDIYEEPWRYNLFVRDNTSGAGIFIKLGSWETGRAYRFKPTTHLLQLLDIQKAA